MKKRKIENEDLVKSIQELTKQTLDASSFWRNFRNGIFFGVGSALGASIIAGIIFGIIAKIYSSFSGILGIF